MDLSSDLEIIMRNALSANNIFFVEQVYVRTKTSFYIFDFVVYGEFCKIVVECDGPHHYNLEQWYLDSRRDLWSIQNGYQDILRFSAPQLANNIDLCIKKINTTISAYDLVFKEDIKTSKIIQSEREKILKQKLNKPNSPVSKYAGLKVIINNIELMDSEKVKLNGDLESPIIESEITTAPHDEYSSENVDLSERIPEKEKKILDIMKVLPNAQKNLLWKIIKKSNKDNITTYEGKINDLNFLINKELLAINPYYKPFNHEISIIVLPRAPYLIRFLK